MSADQSNYSDIDYLLEKKEEELRELGAMRVRALERINDELREEVEKYALMIKEKEDENDQLKEQFMHSSFHREEYEKRIAKLNERLQNKDIEVSELKTSMNTYYNDLMKEKKKNQECRQELVNIFY
jgi:chromosome segregation ATPase